MMKHYKILVVAIVSAVVAILTTLMGVTGTIIGSVISSVAYNVLVEMFEKPVNRPSRERRFDWEVAYIFPLVVIASIQLIMILGFLAKIGLLPFGIFNVYAFIQNLTNYNLYRIMGLALIIMAAYPYLLKSNAVNKTHGKYIFIVGLLFLAKGLSDAPFILTPVFALIFSFLDLPIAVIAFILIIWVILSIFDNKNNDDELDFDDLEVEEVYSSRQEPPVQSRPQPMLVNKPIARKRRAKKSNSFNSSSKNIKFDSRRQYEKRRR